MEPKSEEPSSTVGVAEKQTQKISQSVDSYTPCTISLEEYNKLSRNQKKKLMHKEQWELRADEVKEKQRQKNRESRKRKRAKMAAEGEVPATKRTHEDQEHSGVRIVLDMDFDEKMNEKEIKSICSQVMRCYSANRQARKYVDLHVTKLHGKCKERFDTALDQHKGWSKQFVQMEDREYLDIFGDDNKEDLVYLTADSPNVIETLDPSKIYIIGGIVDKNRYPKLTLEKAEEQGIKHGQLPIGKYVQMSTRKIMTVNQIFEMLIKFIEVGDWKAAFMNVIPQRKFQQNDSNAASSAASEQEEEEKEEDGDEE
ncbi:tRNA (guanine(9)-N(1))-methyltransferase [Dipsacomyces acuminosporus]|nr:tRNA (guanine(9)-N(1))-methyltransferase [Dipsacomyces acuminosporus]